MAKEIIDAELVPASNALCVFDYEEYQDLIEDIRHTTSSVLEDMFDIGCKLKIVNDKKLYEFDSYNDIYEFAADKFGYGSTSVKNLIAVADKYHAEDDEEYLDRKFSDYSYTALVEMLPVEKEKILKDYNPKMSVKAIRNKKKFSQLTDDIKQISEIVNDVIGKVNAASKLCFNDLPKKFILKPQCSFNLTEDKLSVDEIKISVSNTRLPNDNHYCYVDSCDLVSVSHWRSASSKSEDIKALFDLNLLSIEEIKDKIEKYFDGWHESCLQVLKDQDKKSSEVVGLKSKNAYPKTQYMHTCSNPILKFLCGFIDDLFPGVFHVWEIFQESETCYRVPLDSEYGIYLYFVYSDDNGFIVNLGRGDEQWNNLYTLGDIDNQEHLFIEFEDSQDAYENCIKCLLPVYRWLKEFHSTHSKESSESEEEDPDEYDEEEDDDYVE